VATTSKVEEDHAQKENSQYDAEEREGDMLPRREAPNGGKKTGLLDWGKRIG